MFIEILANIKFDIVLYFSRAMLNDDNVVKTSTQLHKYVNKYIHSLLGMWCKSHILIFRTAVRL